MGKQDDGKITIWMLLPVLMLYLWFGSWLLPALAFDGTVRPVADKNGYDDDVIFYDDDDDDGYCATSNMCNGTDCYPHIDDDTSTPDGVYLMTEDLTNVEIMFEMGDPDCGEGVLSTGAGAQQIRVNASECYPVGCDKITGGGNPYAQVYWYCDDSGTPVIQNGGEAIINGNIVDPEVDIDMGTGWTFTPGDDCEADGSDVYFSLFLTNDGQKANNRTACYEGMEWNYLCAAEGRRIFTVGEGMNPGPPGKPDRGK